MKNNLINLNLLLLAILSLEIVGCSVSSVGSRNPNLNAQKTEQTDSVFVDEAKGISNTAVYSPRILFISYSIKKEVLTQEITAHLISRNIVDGKFKENSHHNYHKVNDLEYQLLDGESNILARECVENPLTKTIEYVNDDGMLEKKDIDVDSAEVSFRIQLTQDARTIKLVLLNRETKLNTNLITTLINK